MKSPIDHPRIAIVGLGVGAGFLPICQRHPRAEMAAICQRKPGSLKEIGGKFGVNPLRPGPSAGRELKG